MEGRPGCCRPGAAAAPAAAVRAESPTRSPAVQLGLGPLAVSTPAPPALSTHARQLIQLASWPPPHTCVLCPSAVAEVFSFNGSAPEVINGRLAMIGFVAAVGCELFTGQTLGAQAWANFGFVLKLVLLVSAGTLATIYRGVKNDEAFGPLTPEAELKNGRMAMVRSVLVVVGCRSCCRACRCIKPAALRVAHCGMRALLPRSLRAPADQASPSCLPPTPPTANRWATVPWRSSNCSPDTPCSEDSF